MRRKIIIAVIIAAAATGLFFVIKDQIKSGRDYSEYFTGYDDRIAFVVEGYQMHWDGFAPEDLDLSYIYKYESPYGGFIKYDIDKDGVEELLMGDRFENGDYQIYDIFSFDRTTGDIIHLFCGGERNWCTLCENGIIVENGSNSAEDSFTKYYILKRLKLKKFNSDDSATWESLPLDMDKFINYSQPDRETLCGGYTQQHEPGKEDMDLFHKVMGETTFTPLSVATQVVAGTNYRFWCRYDDGTENAPNHCSITIYQPLHGDPVITGVRDDNAGPEMKIIVDNEGNVGRYVDENETSYHGNIQDDYWIGKDKAKLETVKAGEGYGILTLKEPGKKSAFKLPDARTEIVGTMVHEEGYIPEVYRCLGYIKGWFLVDLNGQSGFIQEELAEWDAVNSF